MAIPSSFGPYLEAKDLLRSPRGGGSGSAPAPSFDSPGLAKALKLLIDAEFPAPVPTLLEQSGMPVDEFSQALGLLDKAGLVELSHEDSGQFAKLTPEGEGIRGG